ncbi:MAG: LarC family nickel insertion protein [Litoreibacter sp.]
MDIVGGLAGDMFAAAILDGWPNLMADVTTAISALEWPEQVPAPSVEKNRDQAITGTRFYPGIPNVGSHEHTHVRWSDIRKQIDAANLEKGITRNAIGIFETLAEAEAKVHGVAVDAVSFHEVGAADSIVDIVAAAVLIDALSPANWTVSHLPLCRGLTPTQHGVLPVPAPATSLLLEGFSFHTDNEWGERITPTGAAILAWLKPTQDHVGAVGTMTKSSVGLGTRQLKSRANMTRCLFFEADAKTTQHDLVAEYRFEIDDQTAEDLAIGLAHIRALDSVIDVVQWQVFGKKGRVATAIQVLADPSANDPVSKMLFHETTTLGLRYSLVERHVLQRDMIERPEGTVKTANRPSQVTAKLDACHVADVSGVANRRIRRQEAETAALRGDGDAD